MNNFSDIMKGSYEMTFNNIVKILVLSQIGSIKQVVPKGIQTVFDNLKKFFLYLFILTKSKLKRKKQLIKLEDIYEDMDPPVDYSKCIPITINDEFMKSFYSYLQKDIYYVNLKEVETNGDIQMIYDYVSKNVSNGGIIVYEDIDCMSDIVLKRTEDVKEMSVNDMVEVEDDRLNLSYFLNLLQGCLTPDGSINILATNFKDKLDPAIFRSGRMDLVLELKPCSRYQIRNIFRKMMMRVRFWRRVRSIGILQLRSFITLRITGDVRR
jgi:hypothetical protein